ncbi:hypothetical protein EDC94DRAFT_602072 [Helicostylum pulchrum]|nr:hypothetical protein EDC94DRAFT_602072 [Helicostylum pulchrum]
MSYLRNQEQQSFEQKYSQMNQSQKFAFDTITRSICCYYRSQGKIVLCVASSGIAALLLPGGTSSMPLWSLAYLVDHPDCWPNTVNFVVPPQFNLKYLKFRYVLFVVTFYSHRY